MTWILILNSLILLILVVSAIFILKSNLLAKKKKEGKPLIESSSEPEEVVSSEKWQSVFNSLKNMNKEISQMQNDISGTFRVHNTYKENLGKAVLNMVSLFKKIKNLKQIPKDSFGAFKSDFSESLKTIGVEEWKPDIGEPVPEGCNQVPAADDSSYPEGAVDKILSPGYRIRESGAIIEKPTVMVVRPKSS